MTCCKAEKYGGWCSRDNVRTVTAKDGKDYCIFHAPEKGNLKEFENEVFSRIKATAKGKSCDFSGTIFEGDISFSSFSNFGENNPLPDINFSRATFSGEASFFNAEFNGGAFFYSATFNGRANFCGAKFKAVSFYGTVFNEKVFFSTCRTDIERVIREKFANREFAEESKLRSKGPIFEGLADFTGATFNKRAYFADTAFPNVARFWGITIVEKVRFEKVNLEKVSFYDLQEVKKMDFINCEWPKKTKISSFTSILYKKGEKNIRDILYDEILMDEEIKKLREGAYGDGPTRYLPYAGKAEESEIRKVELLYRRLKQKYIEEHNWHEVSNWNYCEREMFIKRHPFRRFFLYHDSIDHFRKSFLELFAYGLYRLSSGYGERPFRAGLFLLSLLLGLSIVKMIANMPGEFSPGTWSFIKFLSESIVDTVYSIAYPIIPDGQKTLDTFDKSLRLLSRIFIPLQTGFFALALRNRFRR